MVLHQIQRLRGLISLRKWARNKSQRNLVPSGFGSPRYSRISVRIPVNWNLKENITYGYITWNISPRNVSRSNLGIHHLGIWYLGLYHVGMYHLGKMGF